MKEYQGKQSKVYQQTRGKKYILIPAIKRHLKDIPRGGKMLDVGCGIGDLSLLAKARGLEYYGFDKSADMIKRATQEFPLGSYKVLSATNFTSKYKEKFDVILMSMVLPVLNNHADMVKVFRESKKVLKKGGKILVGEPHPSFDGYMQSFLFNRKGVETKFTGYFTSAAAVSVSHKVSSGTIIFRDHHWTLGDYIQAIHKAGLQIVDIDECPPSKEAKAEKEFYKERNSYPTYMLFELR